MESTVFTLVGAMEITCGCEILIEIDRSLQKPRKTNQIPAVSSEDTVPEKGMCLVLHYRKTRKYTRAVTASA